MPGFPQRSGILGQLFLGGMSQFAFLNPTIKKEEEKKSLLCTDGDIFSKPKLETTESNKKFLCFFHQLRNILENMVHEFRWNFRAFELFIKPTE